MENSRIPKPPKEFSAHIPLYRLSQESCSTPFLQMLDNWIFSTEGRGFGLGTPLSSHLRMVLYKCSQWPPISASPITLMTRAGNGYLLLCYYPDLFANRYPWKHGLNNFIPAVDCMLPSSCKPLCICVRGCINKQRFDWLGHCTAEYRKGSCKGNSGGEQANRARDERQPKREPNTSTALLSTTDLANSPSSRTRMVAPHVKRGACLMVRQLLCSYRNREDYGNYWTVI